MIPTDSLLDKRVLNYKVSLEGGKITSEFIRYIGETSGMGVIKVAESIFADEFNDRLLIAEELEENTHIKVYSLNTGEFTGVTIGEGLFKYQAEVIALINVMEIRDFLFVLTKIQAITLFTFLTEYLSSILRVLNLKIVKTHTECG